jgi:DNA repair exonuclease SbcCD nuclease subunit
MKILGIGDLHINIWTKSNKTQHIFETFKQFEKLIIDEKPDFIVIFGDLFDTKIMTSTEGLINVVNSIDNIATLVPIYIIVGNHDIASASDTTMSLPNVFKNKKNITVIDRYIHISIMQDNIVDKVFHFLPYMPDKELIETINNIKVDKDIDNYLFGHFGVNGYSMNKYDDGTKDFIDNKSLTTPTHLRKFKHVYLGHYHTYQTKENITYIGSPYELKHGEEFGEHGFLVINTDTNKDVLIINENSPKHITLNLNKENMSKLKEIKKNGGYYIKLHVPNKVSKDKLIKLRDDLLKNNFDVQFVVETKDNNKMVVAEGWDDFTKQDSEELIKDFAKQQSEIFKKNNWNEQEMVNVILQ